MNPVRLTVGWQTLFRLLIGLVALVVLSLHVGRIQEIFQVFLQIRLSFFALALFWMAVNFFLQYRKWSFILRIYYPDISRFEIIGSLIAGFTLGIITPGRLGELGRGFFLRRRNKWFITGLSLVDKMSNNLAILVLGSLALYYYFKIIYGLSIFVLWPYSGLVVLVWAGLAYGVYRLPDLAAWLEKKTRLRPRFRKLAPFWNSLLELDLRNSAKILAYSLAIYLAIFAQFVTLLKSLGNYPVFSSLAGVAATMFSKTLLPISLGDLGVREAAAVYFLHQVGILKIHAFDAALLLFGMNVLLPSLIGLFLIPRLSLTENGGMMRSEPERPKKGFGTGSR